MTKLKFSNVVRRLGEIWRKAILAVMNGGEINEPLPPETFNEAQAAPGDRKFDHVMETARKIMARDGDCLRELAR